jgi:subtilisin family serine protease
MARRACLTAAAALLLAGGNAVTAAATADEAGVDPLQDARGLRFVSTEAFCAFHCSAAHVGRAYRHLRAASECSRVLCGDAGDAGDEGRRRLQTYNFSGMADGSYGDVHAASDESESESESGDVTVVSVVSCANVPDVTLSIGDPEQDEFAGFYDAFFAAYDALLASADAAFDACQLQFLQDELLENATSSSSSSSSSASIDAFADADFVNKPTLVKLNATADVSELECLTQLKTLWPPEKESFTPFLTRSDQSDANATTLLLHVGSDVAAAIAALDCVAEVTALPSILKLTPFARSSYALSRDSTKSKEGPALEIRLAVDANATLALARLQASTSAATGIANLLTLRSSSKTNSTSRVLNSAALDDYETWVKALAVIVSDEAVEWVDLKQVVTASVLPAHSSAIERKLRGAVPIVAPPSMAEAQHVELGVDEFVPTIRRLDDYVMDLVGVTTMHDHNITGSDIVVGITDTGLYIDHDQFDQESRDMYDALDATARKVIYYQTFANEYDEAEEIVCGHGTHVSGILAGSSYSTESTDLGIASSAQIAFMDIGNQESSCAGTSGCSVSLETPAEVDDLMSAQVAAGAKIFSFSWGTGANDYNTQTRDIDEYVYNNPEILIVVAGGNSGESGSYTISSPSGAKNVISVGASLNAAASFSSTPCADVLNEDTVASFSSIGPTLDGRQKPDIVAPGMTITSSQSQAPGSTTKTTSLCSLQGTSQATPVIAGMAVLIYEWLRDGWWKSGVKDAAYGMETIPASLLKALILHSGEAMSKRLVAPSSGVTSCVAMEAAALTLSSYPDFNQGYGKPTMLNLVSFSDANSTGGVYFYPNSSGEEPSVVEGDSISYSFLLTENANLRVTLVWTDPAGSVGGKSTLQNDLDLTVQVANTTTYFYPLAGNGTRDAKNNVEMVEVSYDDLLAAANDAGIVADDNGLLHVQAVVSGYSVKAGDNSTTVGQKFSLVASSTPSTASTTSAASTTSSFWQPWMTIGTIVVATLALLFLIAFVWRMRLRKKALEMKPRRHHNRHEHSASASHAHTHPNYQNQPNGRPAGQPAGQPAAPARPVRAASRPRGSSRPRQQFVEFL